MTHPRIKLVLWDFNGVVVNGDHAILSRHFGRIHGTPWQKVYAILYTKYLNLYAMNRITDREAWEGPIRELGWKQDWQKMKWWYLNRQRLQKTVIAYVQTLRRRGYACAVISKNITTWFAYLRKRLGFEKYFDGVVETQSLNLPKSSPQTVRYLCKRFKVKPNEIVYIDDQAANLKAPKQMGVNTILYRNLTQCRRELTKLLD
ncbi:MAG: HAD-IA family hydrolase [Candidatus Kerfeldbacteria bacterium]